MKEDLLKKRKLLYEEYKNLYDLKFYNKTNNEDIDKKRNDIKEYIKTIEYEICNYIDNINTNNIISLKKIDNSIEGEYYIFLNDINRVIGSIRCDGLINKTISNVSIEIDENYRGNKYSKQSIELLSDYLSKNGIDEFYVAINKDNIPSLKLANYNNALKISEDEKKCKYIIKTKEKINKETNNSVIL